MPAEIAAVVLGGLALILVFVMDAVGVMGIAGALKFAACEQCKKWTVHSPHAEKFICRRCRRLERAEAQTAAHWPHLLHLGH